VSLTPERIKQIQVEVMIKIMMGGVTNTFTSPGMWDAYREEIPNHIDWHRSITDGLRLGGLLQAGGKHWALTKDGEKFVTDYSAAENKDAN
jgi:hypothetical protein